MHSLNGRDVVCSARTGSGKTLSYLIPVIEKLYRLRWSGEDGLGALILMPTRELGIQAFEVLRSFAHYHEMSAALVIGGKDLKTEQDLIERMNIVIATPGRLLQHMEETPEFDWTNLKIMVIDEVDRILDMGFKNDVDSILKELPVKKIQTLLFSATIGHSIKELCRTTLKTDHEYIQTHDFERIESVAASGVKEDEDGEDAKLKSITPTTLIHYYMNCEAHEKLDLLFSFLKAHTK